jgi:phospholipid-binding lipoprotein MlaA
MFRYMIHSGITLALVLYLTGCAASNAHLASEIPAMHAVSEFSDDESVSHIKDPWEGFNKGMYKFNYQADRLVLLPVVNAYETAAPRLLQTGVSHFFANIRELRTLYNSMLQAKGKKSLITLGRFLTNSTIGLGGLFDPATSLGWRQQYEDFDRTLESWGIGTGPYLVLPLFGPSTARNASGLAVDGAVRWAVMNGVDPFAGTGAGSEIEMGTSSLETLDLRHRESFRYYESDYPFEYYMVRYIFSERRELTTIR